MAVTRLGLMAIPMVGSDQDFSGKTPDASGNVGSGGTGSQTGGTGRLSRRRGRRGFLVNPWLVVRDWFRRRAD